MAVTAWLAFVKKEDVVSEDDPDMDVRKVYKVMWSIVRLKSEPTQSAQKSRSALTSSCRHSIIPYRAPGVQDWVSSE